MTRARPLLVSNDPDVVDDVLRLAAANGVDVHLAADVDASRSRWATAPLVLVGADLAAGVAGQRPSRRRDVVLVTRTPTSDDWQRAVALGAEHVAALPDAERWLIDRLADCAEGVPRDGIVAGVIGSGAGAGASTLAVTLALAGAARALRVLLVDVDPLGGGLDVLLGVEDADGIRWSDLAGSRGRLSAASLADGLPQVCGVSVLSADRGAPALTPDAVGAVLDAGRRGFDLVVADLPRRIDPVVETVMARAARTLVVVTPHVRSVAAVSRLADALGVVGGPFGVVLRGDRRALSEDGVEAALPLPVVGRLPHHPVLMQRADEGEPPSLRDAYGRSCQALLTTLRPAG